MLIKQRKHVSRNAVSRMKPYKLVGFQTKLPSALTNGQQNLISFQLREVCNRQGKEAKEQKGKGRDRGVARN